MRFTGIVERSRSESSSFEQTAQKIDTSQSAA